MTAENGCRQAEAAAAPETNEANQRVGRPLCTHTARAFVISCLHPSFSLSLSFFRCFSLQPHSHQPTNHLLPSWLAKRPEGFSRLKPLGRARQRQRLRGEMKRGWGRGQEQRKRETHLLLLRWRRQQQQKLHTCCWSLGRRPT